jgi:hypothetical protein
MISSHYYLFASKTMRLLIYKEKNGAGGIAPCSVILQSYRFLILSIVST